MSAKFTKLQEVDLTLEDPIAVQNGEAESEENNINTVSSISQDEEYQPQEGGMVKLDLESNTCNKKDLVTFIHKWKFWRKPYRSKYNVTSARPRGLRTNGACRKCSCKVNSWRAVVITLLAFTAAVLISVVISRLVTEPPGEPNPAPGAVATDAPVCAEMSTSILKQNGSAVDAAITALLCQGVVHAESSGIGGGGFMVVRHSNGSVYSISFRETAPSRATENMFHANSQLSLAGGLAVGVPGELRGMELAHKLFGRLKWKDLFTPVISMCENGFKMTVHGERAVSAVWNSTRYPQLISPNFKAIYLNEDESLKKTGDLIVRPDLANTLRILSEKGADAFYNGPIAESIVRAVNSNVISGILTLEDLSNYRADLQEPVHTKYGEYDIYSVPSPGGGPLLLFTLSVMDNYNLSEAAASDGPPALNLTYHRLVEAFKYGFALRTQLGDPYCDYCSDIARGILAVEANMTSNDYAAGVSASISDDHTYNVSHYHAHYSGAVDSGTTHLSVLDRDGQAVAITSSVNTYFGSMVMTDTGIMLNNDMNDFSFPNVTNDYGIPPSPANFIRPGKRALSSTCPTIIVKRTANQSIPHLVTGASGGTHIPTAVAQAILRFLSLSESLSEAIEARRVHHQLVPNEVCPEAGFPKSIQEFLASRGHVVHCRHPGSYAAVQGVGVFGGDMIAHADSRKLAVATIKD